jgi:uncharacterized protein YndB with AHSA1/START domain
MPEPLVVRREVQIAAPPSTVFALLTDPDRILLWMGTEAELEPQPGGIYRLNLNDRAKARGRFTEVVPVHRLAYTFGWEGNDNVPPESTQIEIDLIDRDGGTLLRMAHNGLPNQTECDNHERGWAHYLDRLAIAATGGDPGPDVMREE